MHGLGSLEFQIYPFQPKHVSMTTSRRLKTCLDTDNKWLYMYEQSLDEIKT